MIIGFFLGQQAAGIFNVAERIIMLCKNSVGVLFLGIFPKICSIGIGNTAEFKKTLRFMLKTYILIFSVGTVLLICFLHPIILFFTKHSVSLIKHYVICLSLLPLIAAVGQPAYITLLLHDKKNIYFSAYFFGLVLNLIISFIMCFYFSVAGILFTLIVTEIFISTYMNYFVYKEDKMNYLKSQSNH
jgi:O-antigen/teichoic acid export membrane protein